MPCHDQLISQPDQIEGAKVVIVKPNRSAAGFDQPGHQVDDRCLAGAAGTDNPQSPAGGNLEAQVVEDGNGEIMAERDVAELDASADRGQPEVSRCAFALGWQIQKLEDAVHRYACALQAQIEIDQRLQRTERTREGGRKCHQAANRHLPFDHQVSAVKRDQGGAQKAGAGRSAPAEVREHLEPRNGFDEGDAQGGKTSVLDFFSNEKFYKLYRRQRLHQEGRNRRIELAYGAGLAADQWPKLRPPVMFEG